MRPRLGQRGILGVLGVVCIVILASWTLAYAQGTFSGGSDNDDDDDEAVPYKGSIAAPEERGEEGESAEDEAAEESSLQKLAKIDRSAAERAALRTVRGSVQSTELTDEGGYVVYEVIIAGEDGQTHEVTVDAGNARVMQQEVEENESDEAGEDE
jgi:uncharacterized membrane protein YkoI